MKIPCKTCIIFPICQREILKPVYPILVISFRKQIYEFCTRCTILLNYIGGYRFGDKPNQAFNSVVDFYLDLARKKRLKNEFSV
jgi:hypothetical protein